LSDEPLSVAVDLYITSVVRESLKKNRDTLLQQHNYLDQSVNYLGHAFKLGIVLAIFFVIIRATHQESTDVKSTTIAASNNGKSPSGGDGSSTRAVQSPAPPAIDAKPGPVGASPSLAANRSQLPPQKSGKAVVHTR
jgi:hypothetical protein